MDKIKMPSRSARRTSPQGYQLLVNEDVGAKA
eukprot:CAMPEP_0195105622 /NCGR_PEP_ID=MMETSP0448-20130528/77165_1 /TAXON_ID=66468 /ORGANISM="Heterocapsa triquestra, Strain CCMP 448" /LENGTH=31 /DNA_ID= /DNA_START= /DNA_END= /DNA_ORIENTATION=